MSKLSEIEADYLIAYLKVMSLHPDPSKVFEAAKSTADAWGKCRVACEFEDDFSSQMTAVSLRNQ